MLIDINKFLVMKNNDKMKYVFHLRFGLEVYYGWRERGFVKLVKIFNKKKKL